MKKILPLTHGLRGAIEVPGDKSISHRAIILSTLGNSPVEVTNFLAGADCLSTVACMKALGTKIERADDKILITGNGLHGLRAPESILDCGNSGTTTRLISGILASQPFSCSMVGDASLKKRPMRRIMPL